MKKLGLLLLVLAPLLAGCNPGPNDPGLRFYAPDRDSRLYAPYDNDYGRRGGTRPIRVFRRDAYSSSQTSSMRQPL